jgi:hypothetical protein
VFGRAFAWSELCSVQRKQFCDQANQHNEEKPMPRELIDTTKDKRYVRRDDAGRFNEVDDVGRSLASDTRRKAKTRVPAGEGDRGDQKRAGTASRQRTTAGKTSGKSRTNKKTTAARSSSKRTATKRAPARTASSKRKTGASARGRGAGKSTGRRG